MQRYENLVYINNGVNGQQINAIHMGYRQTGAVYTCRSGSVQVQPDRPPTVSELESVLTLPVSRYAVTHVNGIILLTVIYV